jgi:hypothetical protein
VGDPSEISDTIEEGIRPSDIGIDAGIGYTFVDLPLEHFSTQTGSEFGSYATDLSAPSAYPRLPAIPRLPAGPTPPAGPILSAGPSLSIYVPVHERSMYNDGISSQNYFEPLGPELLLLQAVRYGTETQLTDALEAKIDPNTFRFEGQTLLHLAASRAVPNILRLLLNAGSDPDLQDGLGETPMHIHSSEMSRAHFEK